MYTFDAEKATNECVKWIRDWFEKNGKGCNAVIGISGGKDSTVVAALCTAALGSERVIGITLPNGIQADINDSIEIIDWLHINGMEINIHDVSKAMFDQMKNIKIYGIHSSLMSKTCDHSPLYLMKPELTRQAEENLPPRLRMAALYMVAQCCNGRVSNNCNLSENWIGYSTIYGDTAGDFSPISNFTVSEVIQIGRVLGIPEKFLMKAPSDGLCGKTDEEKIGFTYAVLDKYLRTGEIEDMYVRGLIDAMHIRNSFKHELMASFKWGEVLAA